MFVSVRVWMVERIRSLCDKTDKDRDRHRRKQCADQDCSDHSEFLDVGHVSGVTHAQRTKTALDAVEEVPSDEKAGDRVQEGAPWDLEGADDFGLGDQVAVHEARHTEVGHVDDQKHQDDHAAE